jgi:hypothetical protein
MAVGWVPLSRFPIDAPIDELQRRQAGRKLSSSWPPPSATGVRWSIVPAQPPQRQHTCPQRAKTTARSFRQPGGWTHPAMPLV